MQIHLIVVFDRLFAQAIGEDCKVQCVESHSSWLKKWRRQEGFCCNLKCSRGSETIEMCPVRTSYCKTDVRAEMLGF